MGAARMMRVGTIGLVSLWLCACTGEDPEITVNGLVDGLDAPDLSSTGPKRCEDSSECADVELAPCEVAACLPDGTCGAVAADDGASCDDGNPCTGPDRCVAGACVAGDPQAGSCDDADPCTPQSTCAEGACVGEGVIACDDGDPCTDDFCEPGVGCAGTARTCPDPEDHPCERGVCDSDTGDCVTAPRAEGEACDDGLACSVGATCHDGACVGFVGPECDDDNPCTVDFCAAEGCGHNAVPGPCDDGDACTSGDVCSEGECVGTLMPCDDDDPCTADACFGGQCKFTPIEGCEPPSPGCDGKADGAPCDDGDVSTIADLCAASVCRGFTLVRAPVAASGEHRRLTRVTYAGGEWTAAMSLSDTADDATGILADVSTAGVVATFPGTRQEAAFADVHGVFAIDDGGVLWVRDEGQWSDDQPLRWALEDTGYGEPHGLWTYRTEGGGVRLWAVGEAVFGGAWVRRCVASSPTAQDASCNVQSVITSEDPVLRAVTGRLACVGEVCTPSLVAAADLFEATGFDGLPRWFNDVYAQNGTAGGTWQIAAYDPGQSLMTSNDAAPVDGGGFIVVGGYGYMRTNAVADLWVLNPQMVIEDQDQRHFEGVWSGDGVVVVVGWRAVGAGQRRLELLVGDVSGDLSSSEAWRRYELGTESGSTSGLFDVTGSGDAWMIVGAGRTSAAAPAQGLVYVREP